MTTIEEVAEFYRRVDAVRDLTAMRGILDAKVRQLGFDRFAYVQLKVPGGRERQYIGTYPVDWSDFYQERRLQLHDPIWAENYRSVQPYLWSDVVSRSDDLKTAERLVLGPGADVGLRSGAVVPLHGPDGIVATFVVASDATPAAMRDLFHERRIELQLVAHAAHARITAFGMVTNRADPVPLSARQRDVLYWLVQGKTNWEIGEILSIAEDTVRQHVGKISRLLNVKNRTQLAGMAAMHDLLTFQD